MARGAASGVHEIVRGDGVAVIREPAPPQDSEPDAPTARARVATVAIAAWIAGITRRDRNIGPVGLIVACLGSGIGLPWLLGPGSLTDDDAVRAQLAELGAKLDAQAVKLDAQATKIDAQTESLAAQRADLQAQAIESKQLAARVLECETDIREVGNQSNDLTVWIAAAIPQLAAGIEDVAEASGSRVRIALPDLPGRARR